MLPTIPTDNLAKFLAIGGLILAGAGWWWTGEVQDRLLAAEVAAREQYVEFVTEMETRMNVMASLVSPKKELRVRLADRGADGQLTMVSAGAIIPVLGDAEYREGYRGGLAHYDGFLASCQPSGAARAPEAEAAFPPGAVKELRGKLRAHGTAVENLWRRADSAKSTRRVTGAGTVIGLALSAAGFVGWWRGQRRADELERMKLLKDAQEVEKGKLPPTITSPESSAQTPPPSAHSPSVSVAT